MRGWWCRLVVGGLVGAVALSLVAASGAWADTISATCTWGGQSQACDSTTWYPGAVSVTWQASPAPDSTSGCLLGIAYHFNTDTVSTVSCSATWPGPSMASQQYTLHVEISTPSVSAAPARSPDSNGWYNHPVTAAVSGSSFSGIASCTPTTYSGPDSTTATVTGSCTDNAGKTASATSNPFPYEASTPTVSVTPSRPPDSNGWYNHPVAATVKGSSFSGIASCTPGTYSGPDSSTATVTGSCTDNAGKTASATSNPFLYDASPPLLHVTADPADGVVALHWAIADIAALVSVRIERSPGYRSGPASVVYRGNGDAYRDGSVLNGTTYRYTLVVTDRAGNTSAQSLMVTPGPRLLAPERESLVSAPPLLKWTPVRRARYYNVQLYRGGRKILSAWPARAGLQLRASWQFDGRRYGLRPGRYRWYVWPGLGRRAAARYGPEIGSSTFVVTRGQISP